MRDRPGVVTLVAILLFISAAFNAVVGIALIVEKDVGDLQNIFGTDANGLVGTGIGELIVAGLVLLVGLAIWGGAKWGRIVVAVVMAIRLGVSGWWLITHLGGGLQWNAVINVAFALFILWALYGNKESQEYFEGAL